MVNFLLQNSADINQRSPTGTTPLWIAIAMEHVNIVHLLLSYEEAISVNDQGPQSFTALIFASANGRLKIATFLLEHPNINVNAVDDQGRTAFWWAASGGHFDVVQVLSKERGIKKRLKDLEGKTAYAIAKDHNHVNVRLYLRSF